MTYNVVETAEKKFGIKQISQNGSSMGMMKETFDTNADAEAFVSSLPTDITPEEAAEAEKIAVSKQEAEDQGVDTVAAEASAVTVEVTPEETDPESASGEDTSAAEAPVDTTAPGETASQ